MVAFCTASKCISTVLFSLICKIASRINKNWWILDKQVDREGTLQCGVTTRFCIVTHILSNFICIHAMLDLVTSLNQYALCIP